MKYSADTARQKLAQKINELRVNEATQLAEQRIILAQKRAEQRIMLAQKRKEQRLIRNLTEIAATAALDGKMEVAIEYDIESLSCEIIADRGFELIEREPIFTANEIIRNHLSLLANKDLLEKVHRWRKAFYVIHRSKKGSNAMRHAARDEIISEAAELIKSWCGFAENYEDEPFESLSAHTATCAQLMRVEDALEIGSLVDTYESQVEVLLSWENAGPTILDNELFSAKTLHFLASVAGQRALKRIAHAVDVSIESLKSTVDVLVECKRKTIHVNFMNGIEVKFPLSEENFVRILEIMGFKVTMMKKRTLRESGNLLRLSF